MTRVTWAAALLLLASCGGSAFDDGVTAYRDGRYEDAHAAFAAIADPAPEVLYDLALSALRAGLLDEAEDAAQTLAGGDEPDDRGRGQFLTGSVALARATRAAAQARAVEAEPFAFEIAIRRAETAAQSFGRAALSVPAWPAAGRNVERALRLARSLRDQQRQAAAKRDRKTAGGGARVRPVAVSPRSAEDGERKGLRDAPPPPDSGTSRTPGAGAGVTTTELTNEQVLGLIERLRGKERAKRAARRAARRGAQSGVEKDW